ncbi:transcriptional corepressor SEUSS [Canna indica]|uniref:Transcriptional corepressor SEUSS n=1 Tax=Canna indica TaxID=4628 RepID=A0AAQ3KZP2_9LILI|nr:transcriptional corepressor SEUSS [Canna indica]
MLPSGNPNPVNRNQSVPSPLRADSGILVGMQVGSLPLQQPLSSMVSPLSQLNTNNMSLSGNIPNQPLLNHSLGSRGPVSGGWLAATSVNHQQQNGVGAVDMLGPAELDPLSNAPPSVSARRQLVTNLSASQMTLDYSQSKKFDGIHKFRRSFSMPHNQQQAQLREGLGNIGSVAPFKHETITGSHQNGLLQHLPSLCGIGSVKLERQQLPSTGGLGLVKLEPQVGSSVGSGLPQHLSPLSGIGSVKLEQQQLHSAGGLCPVKLESQQSDSALLLQHLQLSPQLHQQQQRQLLQMPRAPSQAASAQICLSQQQRVLQLQQQMLKNLPQQQQNQLQQQLQQSTSIQPQVKPMLYEPGMCAQRLTHYMYRQKNRPDDNNIEFWKKFVAEYFSPNAKKRWCVSCYGNGRQTGGVYTQDKWHCDICNNKPGRGFETTVEFLPRLFQNKYATGTMEELLYVDMPHEYQNTSGQIVLDYSKATEESVLEHSRVVREGQLRIVFSPDLKICSWEFCARRHEELIPRHLLMPKVNQLGAMVQKFQNFTQNSPSNISNQDLESTCNSVMETARQLAKSFEVPLLNDLGYTKGFVRCLQISEVVHIMKDLIDYSKETGTSPIGSLMNFPKRTCASFKFHSPQVLQPEDQKTTLQNTISSHQTPAHLSGMPVSSVSNGVINISNSLSNMPSTSSSTFVLHQNSMNSRQENQTSNGTETCAGNSIQLPSARSSNSLPTLQPNISPLLSSSSTLNTIPTSTSQISHLNSGHSPVNMSTLLMEQPLALSHENDPTESQITVQRIMQNMMNSQLHGFSSINNELKGVNGITPALNGGSCLVSSANSNSLGVGKTAVTPSAGMANTMAMNAQVQVTNLSHDGSALNHQQNQDMGNKHLGRPELVDNFDDLLFDWDSSP